MNFPAQPQCSWKVMEHYREPENWKTATSVASFTGKGAASFCQAPSNTLNVNTLKNEIDY